VSALTQYGPIGLANLGEEDIQYQIIAIISNLKGHDGFQICKRRAFVFRSERRSFYGQPTFVEDSCVAALMASRERDWGDDPLSSRSAAEFKSR